MMHYTITGSGQPLVLLHGFPNDSSAWNDIVPALSAGYRIILPDLPGAGKSPLPQEPLTMSYMAAAVIGILDKEGIDKAVIAGHSMGGYTAMQIAAMAPDRIKGLSLIHSLASADSEEKKANRRKAIALIRKGDKEKEMFLKGMAQNLFAQAFAERKPGAVKEVIQNGLKLSGATLIAFYEAIMGRADHRSLLAGIKYPVQWIVGEEDTATPMKEALEQCHLAPVNDLCLYRNCGHMSMIEMPEKLESDLKKFLAFVYS
jgi:pimeloyl-ACP methyl ester carboxylesterase